MSSADTSQSDRVVDLKIIDGVATITLDSQSNRNALSRQLLSELHAALDAAEAVRSEQSC
jgi:enoyl-CoA hydratase/carnithine racemase